MLQWTSTLQPKRTLNPATQLPVRMCINDQIVLFLLLVV